MWTTARLEDRPPTSEGPGWAHRECAAHRLEAFGGEIVLGGKMDQFAVEPKHHGEEPVAQPHGALDDDVEDGLEVRRRARDHPQDLGRGRLLLQGLGHLRWLVSADSSLQFREQADVLDGDHRLVGEGLEERDLLGREGIGLGPPIDEVDDAKRRTLAQQRRRHHGPDVGPTLPQAGHRCRELGLGGQDVLDVDRPPVAHHPSADACRD